MNKFLGLAAMSLLGIALAADPPAAYGPNCSGCHGAQGQGVPGAFPPLANNPRLQDEAYVLKVIKEGLKGPIEVAGQTYNGQMPPMPQVSDADAKAIAAYFKGLAGAAAQPPAAPVASAPAATGDGVKGRALFTGGVRFQNGGAPCMACHTAGNIGQMGGGNLGLDKTDLFTRVGAAGISAMLDNPAFPVMREAFKGKTFTAREKADLIAFFQQVANEPTRPASIYSGRMFYAAFFGALALFIVMYLVWINRREGLGERIRRSQRSAR